MMKAIQNIVKSASKIVFILLAISACAGFFTGILEQDNFMILATCAFTFYFTSKPVDKNGEITK